MNETDSTENLEAASNKLEAATKRIEAALMRIERAADAFAEQGEIIAKLQNDIVQLSLQKNELASKFEQSHLREKKLDAGAEEVSRRLIGAMETIKSVLVK